MSFTVQKRTEFKDVNGIEWKIDILKDAAAPATVTTLVASGDPLRISWNNDNDDVFNPIRDSVASFTVYSETQFALADLYASDDLEWKVNIYEATVLYWSGFIKANDYREDYDQPPYPVTINAVCGLAVLKNTLYDDSGTYHNGRRLKSQVILDCLGKVGYTGFHEYVNIFEESMDDSAGFTQPYSPFDQAKVDADVFQDRYCDEVLSEVLKTFNAVITHYKGAFIIYRPVELAEAFVYGRVFTGASTHTATGWSPVQYINRSTHATVLTQAPGGVMMIQTPASKVNVNQDYGNKENWIINGEFKSNKFSGTVVTGVEAEGWTRAGGQTIAPLNAAIIDETDGVMLTNHNNYPTLDHYIYQKFAFYSVASSDVLSIEFDFKIINESGSDAFARTFYIEVKSDDYDRWLYRVDGIDCAWDTSSNQFTYAYPATEGVSEWKSIKRSIPGLPYGASYTIKIFGLDNDETSVFLAIKNLKVYATADEITIKKYKESYFPFVWSKWKKTRIYKDVEEITQNKYTVDNSINGNIMDYDYLVGDVVDSGIDNVFEQFAGSLATTQTRVDTVTLTGTGGTCLLLVGGITKIVTWDTSLTVTAAAYVTAWAATYLAAGITLTSSGANLIYTATVKGAEFFNFAADDYLPGGDDIGNTSDDLSGTIVYTTPAIVYSTDWNTFFKGGHSTGSESKPLLEIIGDEIAEQYSRPKQLVQMPILNTGTAVSGVNIIGNFQDDLNQYSAANRIFVFNRGDFYVKMRQWVVDLIEII